MGSKDFIKWHQNFPTFCNLASSKYLSNLYQCNYIIQYSCSEPSKIYCTQYVTDFISRLPTSYYCIAIQLLCQIHLLWSHSRARTEYEWLTKSVFTIVKFHLVTSHSAYVATETDSNGSMDYYHQFFCRFRKCKRKVPPPSPLSNDFEKSWFFSKILVTFFFFFR